MHDEKRQPAPAAGESLARLERVLLKNPAIPTLVKVAGGVFSTRSRRDFHLVCEMLGRRNYRLVEAPAGAAAGSAAASAAGETRPQLIDAILAGTVAELRFCEPGRPEMVYYIEVAA